MLSKRINGFTLIELLTVVALIGVVAALEAPSFQKFISKNKAETAANDVSSLIRKARKLAILNSKIVKINISENVFEIKDQKDIPNIKISIPEGVGVKKNDVSNALYFNSRGMLVSAGGAIIGRSVSINFCGSNVAKQVKIKSSLSIDIESIDNSACNKN